MNKILVLNYSNIYSNIVVMIYHHAGVSNIVTQPMGVLNIILKVSIVNVIKMIKDEFAQ